MPTRCRRTTGLCRTGPRRRRRRRAPPCRDSPRWRCCGCQNRCRGCRPPPDGRGRLPSGQSRHGRRPTRLGFAMKIPHSLFSVWAGQTLCAFPFGLAQPVIGRAAGPRGDGQAGIGHPPCSQGHSHGAPAPQRGGHGQDAFHLTVHIIAQIGPITKQKTGAFCQLFTKSSSEAAARASSSSRRAWQSSAACGGVHLPPPGVQGAQHRPCADVAGGQGFQGGDGRAGDAAGEGQPFDGSQSDPQAR